MEETNTSPGPGATPAPGQPATGTPATASATQQPATLTLEEALKRIAELEHSHGNATEELKRHRGKLTAYEKAEQERAAAKQAEEDAKLDELTRTNKQYADLQAQHNATLVELQEIRVNHAVEREASRLNFIRPEIAAKLIDLSEIEFEDGKPTNVGKLLEKIAKAMPELIRQQEPPAQPTQSNTPAPAQSGPIRPALPAMNPGRTAIAPPPNTATPPGKIPRLADVHRRPK